MPTITIDISKFPKEILDRLEKEAEETNSSIPEILSQLVSRFFEEDKLKRSLENQLTSSGILEVDDQEIITIEPGKRGGQPCIRGLRISVYDILSWLAQGMDKDEILEDFPELTYTDILACQKFAADREHNIRSIKSA